MDSWLKNRFRLEIVHTSKFGLQLERGFCVTCETDNVGLLEHGRVFAEEFAYLDCSFKAVADGHAVVHQDERVGALIHLEALLDEVNGLAAVECRVTIEAVLVQDALSGDSAE